MGAIGFAFFIAIGAIGSAFLLGPLGRSIGKRIGGREAGSPDPDAAARLSEMEQRMAELEERVDFAERMLSQSRESAQIDRGAS
jgi:hypothetical protein